MGIDPFALFKAVDYGDVHIVPGDVIESHNRMTTKVLETLEAGSTPIVLGGDHSITFANVRALAKKFKGKIGLIHLDAHADCSSSGVVGFKYDHGTFIRRIYELGCLKGKNYTLIGARGYWPGPDLYQWMKGVDFQWFTMLDVEELGVEAIGKEAAERASEGTEAVWISWDIDSFDPSYAPGTGTPEPNGLTSREGIKLMRILSNSFDVDRFGFDVVEVSPPYDAGESNSYSGGVTSRLANRMIIELLQGLAIKKQGLKGGSPIRPNQYRGKGKTYEF
jgi:agmatinase